MDNDIYVADVDSYVDPQTGILVNKLGLSTQTELDAAEADITSIEIIDFTMESLHSTISVNFETLKAIHYRLFRDIYSWAGEVRTVVISKGSTRFCEPQLIEPQAERIFQELLTDELLMTITDKRAYISRLAYYYSELNMLHPFREGNGRTLRTFMSTLAMYAGNIIAWDEMDPQENIEACKYAASHDESKLAQMFAKIIDFS